MWRAACFPPSVLLSVQRFDIDDLGVHRRFWGVYARGFWIHLVRQVHMGADDDLIPLLGHGRPTEGTNLVSVALEGRGLVGRAGHPKVKAAPGLLFTFPGRASSRVRLEADDVESFSMNVETTNEHGPLGFDRGRVHPETMHAVAVNLCTAIERAWQAPSLEPLVHAAVLELFAQLRAEGLPRPRELVPTPVSDSLRRLGRAVDLALSQTGSRAMLVDVEGASALSARTLQRGFASLCKLWGQREESFRAHVSRTVLARASWAMTHPDATTERIARAVGFASPNAFCRALAQRGMPSPGLVRRRFAALG